MALTAQQECFGDSFLLAVAGAAGCAVSFRRPDDDSIDWTLSCRLSRRPKVDVQMKTWTGDDCFSDPIRYPLKRKNYEDLILTNVLAPRILVLVILPQDPTEWIAISKEQLICRRCGYWVSLAGHPTTENETRVTVSLPRANVLTVESLQTMMQRVNDRGAV
jgi:hypothetical protein